MKILIVKLFSGFVYFMYLSMYFRLLFKWFIESFVILKVVELKKEFVDCGFLIKGNKSDL